MGTALAIVELILGYPASTPFYLLLVIIIARPSAKIVVLFLSLSESCLNFFGREHHST